MESQHPGENRGHGNLAWWPFYGSLKVMYLPKEYPPLLAAKRWPVLNNEQTLAKMSALFTMKYIAPIRKSSLILSPTTQLHVDTGRAGRGVAGRQRMIPRQGLGRQTWSNFDAEGPKDTSHVVRAHSRCGISRHLFCQV